MRVWGSSALVVVLFAAGCGGGAKKASVVTVPAYGDHPQTVVSESNDPKQCALDAGLVAHDSGVFLEHYGAQAAYPADLYYVDLREDYADFQARQCDPAVLGRALHRALTPKQQRTLVAALPAAMAADFSTALRASGTQAPAS
jgi:hypothetical protein